MEDGNNRSLPIYVNNGNPVGLEEWGKGKDVVAGTMLQGDSSGGSHVEDGVKRVECCPSPGSEQVLLEQKEPYTTEGSIIGEAGLGN